MVISNENKQYDIIYLYADGHTITIIKALFMIAPTQQIVCSIVSRQLIADLSSTSRQPVADQSQPISNQLAINRPPVADRSSTGRRLLGIVVADQSPINLQPKKCSFDLAPVALVAAVFSRKAVADRLQYMCDRGLSEPGFCIFCGTAFDTFGGIIVKGPQMLLKFFTLIFKHSGQISAFLIYCLTHRHTDESICNEKLKNEIPI